MTVAAAMKITVGYLYPGLMSADGDRGNIGAIVRRCGWRNISVAVTELSLGDKVTPGEVDILVIGGDASQQRLVAADLYKIKGAGIRDAVAAGAAALVTGGGYELFGRFCQPASGAELRGIELFDSWTIRRDDATGHHDALAPAARAHQVTGDLLVRWGGSLLAGVEHRDGDTYLGPTARPLGQAVRGHGNNGDGSEGCIIGNAVGTNLHGPCLPANPVLADFLIGAALARRHGAVQLPPLADDLELAAHDAAVRRGYLAARGRRLARGLRLPASYPGWPQPRHARRGASPRSGVRR